MILRKATVFQQEETEFRGLNGNNFLLAMILKTNLQKMLLPQHMKTRNKCELCATLNYCGGIRLQVGSVAKGVF